MTSMTSVTSTTSDSPAPWRPAPEREALIVGALLLLLLAVNLATAELYPVVWLDEALHVDPAVSLYRGEGLHSSAWGSQAVTETWVCYPPLFAFLLAGWMRLFGFSLLAVRSFGHVLGLGAIGIVWLAVRRHALLESARARLLLVVLGACGAGISFSYRCGRPDPVLFLIVAAAFLAASVRARPARSVLLLALGALVPLAGLQGVAYAALLGVLLLAVTRGRAAEPVLVHLAGCGLGMAGLAGTLAHLGLWDRFRQVALAANGLGSAFLRSAIGRLELFPTSGIMDPSADVLVMFCLVTLARAGRPPRRASLEPAFFGAASAVLIPTALCAAGRYALYYSWMAWIPVVIGTLVAGEALARAGRPARALSAVLATSACVGLPLQLALAVANGRARSYARVEEVAAAGVPPGAVAYADAAAYYAVRPRASRLFLTSYNDQLTEADLGSIRSVVLRIENVYGFETPHPRIERAFRPLDVPAPPPGPLKADALRLHWAYDDYATLRAWEARPPEPVHTAVRPARRGRGAEAAR